MPRRKRESMNMAGMSGWLFADMLLVLAVVALGAMLASPDSVAAYVKSVRGTTATAKPQVSPTPKPSPTKPHPLALNKTPQEFNLSFDTNALLAGDKATIADVDRQIRAGTLRYAGARAGFVLTFGGNPNPGTATEIARVINQRLMAVRPSLFKGAVLNPFVSLGRTNAANVQIFLYT